MEITFTVDTNTRPLHVRLMSTTELGRFVFQLAPPEAIQLGAILIKAGQHLIEDDTNRIPVIEDMRIVTRDKS